MTFTNENGKKTIAGIDVFVIPNSAYILTNGKHYARPYQLMPEYMAKDAEAMNAKNVDEKHLVSVTYDDVVYNKEIDDLETRGVKSANIPNNWIQVWFVDTDDKSGNSNIANHSELHPAWFIDTRGMNPDIEKEEFWNHPRVKEFLQHQFLGRLPMYLLEGKKEGDEISFEWLGVEFHVRLCQTKYRYARFGKFEDVVAHLMKTSKEE